MSDFDPARDAAYAGRLKWTSLPLAEPRDCTTARHEGQGVPAGFVTLIYEREGDSLLVHEVFTACAECREMMAAEDAPT